MLTWFRKNMKGIMIVVAVVFAASMFYGLSYKGFSGGGKARGSDSIAKVNGEEIDPVRYREIVNRVMANFGQSASPQNLPFIENLALGQAIDFTLMLGEAKKQVRVSGREVDAAVAGIMQQQKVSSRQDLERALQRVGLSYGKFRDLIRDEMLVQKLSVKLRENVQVTPDDLREIRASHILVSKEGEAKDLLSKINQGADFAALAKNYSQDTGSAVKGGDLGFFTAGSMVEQFEKAAFGLKIGEVSGIVQTPFGYHIIKLTGSRLRKFPAGQDVNKVALQEKQEKVFRQWYMGVRSKAKIEVLSPELRGHELRLRGQAAAALSEYKKAMEQNPANPYLHIFMADTYLALGQKALAIAEYENAIKVQGSDPGLYLILGKAYEGMKESALATEQYRRASLIAGDNKAVHEQLLKIFQGMKRPSEVAMERREIQRIEKKDKFQKDLTSGK